jgi:hypothetical protein
MCLSESVNMNETVDRVSVARQPVRTGRAAVQELKVMKAYVKQISQSKADSVAFLQRAGILDKKGDLAKPHRS